MFLKNKYDTTKGYSGNVYDLTDPMVMKNGIIYTSKDPSIFEVKLSIYRYSWTSNRRCTIMHYFEYASADATIYEGTVTQSQNTGLDEILEIRKDTNSNASIINVITSFNKI